MSYDQVDCNTPGVGSDIGQTLGRGPVLSDSCWQLQQTLTVGTKHTGRYASIVGGETTCRACESRGVPTTLWRGGFYWLLGRASQYRELCTSDGFTRWFGMQGFTGSRFRGLTGEPKAMPPTHSGRAYRHYLQYRVSLEIRMF